MESINCTKCGSTDVYFNSIEGVYICKNCDSKFSNAEFEEEHNTKHLIARLKECQRVLDESVAIRKVTKYETAKEYINACSNEAPYQHTKPAPIKYRKIYNYPIGLFLCILPFITISLMVMAVMNLADQYDEHYFGIFMLFLAVPFVVVFIWLLIMYDMKPKYLDYLNKKKQYEKSINEYKIWEMQKEKEYQEIATDENKEKYEQNVIWMNKQNDILPPMYYSRVSDLIEILEGKRADTIKEAINVMVADDYQKKLVNDQKMHIYEQEQLMKAQLESLQQTQLAAEKTAEEAARATRQSNNRY